MGRCCTCGARGQAGGGYTTHGAQDHTPWAHLARYPREAKEGPPQPPSASVNSPLPGRPVPETTALGHGQTILDMQRLRCWFLENRAPQPRGPAQGWLRAGKGRSRSGSRPGTAGGPVAGAEECRATGKQPAFLSAHWAPGGGMWGGPGTPTMTPGRLHSGGCAAQLLGPCPQHLAGICQEHCLIHPSLRGVACDPFTLMWKAGLEWRSSH